VLGLFSRPVAFLMSGEMAFAHFMAHTGVETVRLPLANHGESAVLFYFVFLGAEKDGRRQLERQALAGPVCRCDSAGVPVALGFAGPGPAHREGAGRARRVGLEGLGDPLSKRLKALAVAAGRNARSALEQPAKRGRIFVTRLTSDRVDGI